jgi:peptidoglycan/xylan/chitin deacetylase (PgdA/CDA1 family)
MKRLLTALPIGLVAAGGFVLAAPPLLVDRVERSSPEVIFSGPVDRKVVALTIDDGPAEQTGAILDALAENGEHATFFLIGSRIETRPDVVRRIVDAGHEIGNHTMQETASIRLAPEELERQLLETDALLSRYADPRWFRPGSGWYDGEMLDQARGAGYEVVLASMWPVDAWLPWPPFVARYVSLHARPGAILVLHDGPGRGERTADILRRVLPELRQRGYEVTTVGDLLERAEDAD